MPSPRSTGEGNGRNDGKAKHRRWVVHSHDATRPDVSEVKSDINITPLIDVMLVLLIIFMVVTPIIASGFEAKMPEGKNIEKREDQDNDITLGIDKDGAFFLGSKDAGGTTRIRKVEKSELEETLRKIFDARSSDKILYFKADQQLEYSKVEEAIGVARKAGVRVLAAVTEPTREQRSPFGKR
jgi:biopolymer transport protein ExbD